MPLFHCDKCHHEWEGLKDWTKCDWCKSEGHIIQERTPFEQSIDDGSFARIIEETIKNLKEN